MDDLGGKASGRLIGWAPVVAVVAAVVVVAVVAEVAASLAA